MMNLYCSFILVAVFLAPPICTENTESRQFSSDSFYILDPGEGGEDNIQFPDDKALAEDLDTSESNSRVQGLQFYAIQNGNIPLIIYPVSNGGATAPDDDQQGMATIHQLQSTQADSTNQDFEESLKNVAHGYIFPSNPETTHTDIFKQLLAAGSQGPAPEPYVIPTPQNNKQVNPEPIIAIAIPPSNTLVEDQPQQSLSVHNFNQYSNEPVYLSQNMENIENQPQTTPQYSSDINTIPVELKYLQDKPSHYHMVGPQVFGESDNNKPMQDKEIPFTQPYKEQEKTPLQPPPPMKASTYGPPQPVHTPPPIINHSNRYRLSNHRPSGPPHPPSYQMKGGSSPHIKGPMKISLPHHSYRLHSGPHQHHGSHHHHGHQYHPHHHEDSHHHYRDPHYHHNHHHDDHEDSHRHRPPPKFHYEVHEMNPNGNGPIYHSRPPLQLPHKHPYNFHYYSPPKQSTFSSHLPSNPTIHGGSRPPYHSQEPLNKPPPFNYGSQKGSRPYGPPKTVSYNPPSSSNLVASHPSLTKAIFHSSHSPDQTASQTAEYNPIKELHNYPPLRSEYNIETPSTTHPTLSYNTAIEAHRPSDSSPSGSIEEPYVTGPPRINYPNEEEEEPSPPVEVYSPLSEQYYGADSYQRIKQTFKSPVIVYKGVRPPVRVYQKPETGPPYHYLPTPHSVHGSVTQSHASSHSYSPSIESTWVNHNAASTPYYHQQRVRGSYSVASPSASSKSSDTPSSSNPKETHITTTTAPFRYSPSSSSISSSSPVDSLSLSSDDSSSWTPINAPAGAVPARAYHIPAPDLSRGSSQPSNHNSYYSSPNSRADMEDLVLVEQNDNGLSTASSANVPLTSIGNNHLRRENNSEEVVSAVVLVKHR